MNIGLLIEFLNYTAILCGIVGKMPQIQMLFRTKNVKGLSMKSTIMELLAFLIISSYCAKQGYALLSYLEVVAAVIQTLVFILMLLYYQGTLTVISGGSVGAVLAIFYSFYLGIPHDSILDVLVTGTALFLASSKILQLNELRVTKNSNNVSISRWLLASYISIARVFTNLAGVADKALLLNSSVAFVLNVSIVVYAHLLRQGKEHGQKKSKSTNKVSNENQNHRNKKSN